MVSLIDIRIINSNKTMEEVALSRLNMSRDVFIMTISGEMYHVTGKDMSFTCQINEKPSLAVDGVAKSRAWNRFETVGSV